MSEITQLLERAETGDAQALHDLLPLVYEELRKVAAHKMSGEAAGHTLQPTALVHEAWLRLAGDASPRFENRAHFFGAAAEAMRRILIERARRRMAVKRGAGAEVILVRAAELGPAHDDHKSAVPPFGRQPPDKLCHAARTRQSSLRGPLEQPTLLLQFTGWSFSR